jgi:predicted O-methyltransferase YrrM
MTQPPATHILRRSWRLVPERRRAQLRVLTRRAPRERYSRNETTFSHRARLCPLVTDVFHQIRDIRGYFTYDDCTHFALVLQLQTALGLRGDMLEIGAYYGRSTAVLAHYLAKEEQLLVCDPFEAEVVYGYESPPTRDAVEHSVSRLSSAVLDGRLEIVEGFSRDLDLTNRTFRFAHIDGSHQFEDALADMRLAASHLRPGGVVVVDDYEHPDFPDVARAVIAFRAAHPEFLELADLNRHAEPGRKLYLLRSLTTRL